MSRDHKSIARQVLCADGTRLSVQASWGHYSTPRESRGPYTEVEVGYPTAKPPQSWAEYFDGDDFESRWGESVYAYVPTQLVAEYIAEHGGVDVSWLTGPDAEAQP